MASTIDEITMNYEEEDVLVVKELDKEILTRGAWSTILFKYQDWDKRKEEYGPVKFSIRRYQKRNNVFSQKSKFNISNVEQAMKIIATLQRWSDEQGASAEGQ